MKKRLQLSLKLTIRNKLIGGLGLAALALLLIGLLGIVQQHRANARIGGIYNRDVQPLLLLDDLKSQLAGNRSAIDQLLRSGDSGSIQGTIKAIGYRNAQADKDWNAYYPAMISDAGEREDAQDVLRGRLRLDRLQQQIIEQLQQHRIADAQRSGDELTPRFNSVAFALDAIAKRQQQQIDAAYLASQSAYAWSLGLNLLLMLAGMAAIGVLLVLMLRSISAPIEQAVGMASAIAGGQLNHQVQVHYDDEVGRLLRALQAMDGELARIVGQVRDGADAVSAAAGQLSQGNDDLSQRTQEQASSLEETAASMEQMTATVKQNADNAQRAADLAGSARHEAETGGEVIHRAVAAMDDIQQASERIADVAGLIDEIAFQTNLLALNAAVEAARAGDAGRGFAVVAGEVRELAQRSAQAAREVKTLVGDTSHKVETGHALVQASGEALQKIRQRVRHVSDIVAEIAAASGEQSAGIDQVNLAVTRMDDMTQQNASLVEQAAAAARAMQEQAGQLQRQVGFFRLAG